ncbi:hypothetical protein Bcav_1077 [Beutenbergia cavernae DSM 12333]|uniref:DUF4307 domain-containing protein n=1 Tax=Beutenbergia cavernae (strain ATCC BAA-8 / DSM 12333 / CCUG 43141 / JCM 11478 / NBRC 16432 / NCIMB 13614 / HKI 0122) TaxID=471853 RepID=C5C0F1_BEUC1|nr:DUF4307 domain-containing protein [Beutenbergia cavernae]ACQ79337.1 hypothetical protein Bcav_1077 [Beutenbergia cavernae DSM 12333]
MTSAPDARSAAAPAAAEHTAYLAERYGAPRDPRRTRRLLVVVVAALVVLGGVAVTWVALAQARVEIRTRDVGYEIISDERTDITFDVIRSDPSTTVRCAAQALDRGFGQVGVAEVVVGPSDRTATRVTVEVATIQRASNGIVVEGACVTLPAETSDVE